MLKYWSNAFMTTGAAIVATAIFTDAKEYGVFVGVLCVVFGAFLCYLSLLQGDKK